MQKENQNTSENDVMRAMAKFLLELWYEEDFRDQPEYLTEIFETILSNEMGDDQNLRIQMICALRISKLLAKTLGPFSDLEIRDASQKILNA